MGFLKFVRLWSASVLIFNIIIFITKEIFIGWMWTSAITALVISVLAIATHEEEDNGSYDELGPTAMKK